MRTPVFLVLTAALTAVTLPSWHRQDDSERDAVALQIRERLAELQVVREERETAAQDHRNARRRLASTLDSLESEQRRLQAENELLQAEVEELVGEATTSEQTEAATDFLREFVAAAAPIVQRLRTGVESGIPFQRDQRLGRIAEVEARLKDPGSVDAKVLAELWSWAGEELRLAGGIEFFNEPVILEGGSRLEHAYHLRLGLGHEFVISEDTRWIARARGEDWVVLDDAEEREALILALRVLQRQEPPSVVTLPLPMEGR